MRFRLRTLLIVLSLLSVLCAVAGWSWRRNAAERATARFLVAQGARCDYSGGIPLGPLEDLIDARLGREFRSDVNTVHVDYPDANDPEVVLALRRLPGLRQVKVSCWRGMDEASTKLQREMQGTSVDVRTVYEVW